MNTKRNSILIINRIIEVLSDISDNEYEKLLDDSYSIKIKLVKNKKINKHTDQVKNLSKISNELLKIDSRQTAQLFLDQEIKNKKQLEELAKHLDIQASKKDNIENIKNKIIESTVGAMLRSEAIYDGIDETPFPPADDKHTHQTLPQKEPSKEE